MTRQVQPAEARLGAYIDSFPAWQYREMLRTVESLERLAKQLERRKGIPRREIVYTLIKAWGHSDRNNTWQIYMLPESRK